MGGQALSARREVRSAQRERLSFLRQVLEELGEDVHECRDTRRDVPRGPSRACRGPVPAPRGPLPAPRGSPRRPSRPLPMPSRPLVARRRPLVAARRPFAALRCRPLAPRGPLVKARRPPRAASGPLAASRGSRPRRDDLSSDRADLLALRDVPSSFPAGPCLCLAVLSARDEDAGLRRPVTSESAGTRRSFPDVVRPPVTAPASDTASRPSRRDTDTLRPAHRRSPPRTFRRPPSPARALATSPRHPSLPPRPNPDPCC